MRSSRSVITHLRKVRWPKKHTIISRFMTLIHSSWQEMKIMVSFEKQHKVILYPPQSLASLVSVPDTQARPVHPGGEFPPSPETCWETLHYSSMHLLRKRNITDQKKDTTTKHTQKGRFTYFIHERLVLISISLHPLCLPVFTCFIAS